MKVVQLFQSVKKHKTAKERPAPVPLFLYGVETPWGTSYIVQAETLEKAGQMVVEHQKVLDIADGLSGKQAMPLSKIEGLDYRFLLIAQPTRKTRRGKKKGTKK